jgi:hypothetical protein
MKELQEVFNRIQEVKKEQKGIKATYTDALAMSESHKKVSDELKVLRENKKEIELTIRQELASELNKLDDLKDNIKNEIELLSDIALSKLMKGETVAITDEYSNIYEPVFTVKFRKSNGGRESE